jgi:hypothetical protein
MIIHAARYVQDVITVLTPVKGSVLCVVRSEGESSFLLGVQYTAVYLLLMHLI